MKLNGCVIAACGTWALAQAPQGRAVRPEFAVVSVKPNNTGCCVGYGIGRGGAHGTYVSLKMLIGLAYQIPPFRISAGPSWSASDRFDVACKADESAADNSRLRTMLQAMLEDRFKLKLHRETRQSAVYTLEVVKGGPKIRSSSDQRSPDDARPGQPGEGPPRGSLLVGDGLVIANAAALEQLATQLMLRLGRPVIDRTGLIGRFDFELHWSPDRPGAPPVPDAGAPEGSPLPSDAPSLFTAIQEQLGLRLAPANGPVDFLVIDHAERPGAN